MTIKNVACLAALTLLTLGNTGCGGPGSNRDSDPQSADILITNGTIITMDGERRVLENAAIAIVGDRIAAIGPTEELEAGFAAEQVIDASDNVVMPGLIDGHGHAGHGLVKSLGTDTGEWYGATESIYALGSTELFWRADALLTAVERLRFGVTTGLTYFGGGDSVMRTDDPRYGDAYLAQSAPVDHPSLEHTPIGKATRAPRCR
jgi:hypothetical protein